ncbi:MAG: hypothetical protein L6311_13445, partial [Cellulomonas sp.]|nr:hypothetical protein [Cellulomonas sp.]
PPRYREWARDDIDGRWFVTRRFLRPLAPILVAIWGVPIAIGGPPIDAVPALAVVVVGLPFALRFDLLRPQHDYLRAAAATRNLLPRAGEPPTPGGFGQAWGPRPRLTARVGTILAGTGLALGAVMWTTTALIAPRGLALAGCQPEPGANSCFTIDPGPWDPQEWAAVAVIAVIVGLGLAGLAMRRTARLLGDRPAQPARVLVSRAPRVVGALVLLVPLAGWQAWLEATGRWVVLVSPWAAAICLLMLPGALVAARVARRGPSDLALVDLWQIGVHGRAPRVDPWVVAVVRVPPAAAAPSGPDAPTGDGTAIAT